MTAAKAREKAKAKRQREKNRKKIIARKISSHKAGFIILLSLGLIISLTSANLWSNIEKIRDKNAQIAAMEKEYNHRRIQNDALRQKLDSPIDEEYIIEVARENGYRKSDEIMFYLTDRD